MRLQEHAIIWKSDKPVQDCCLGTMDELVAAGHIKDCWCGNSIRAVDGLMEKDYTGDMDDFDPIEDPIAIERDLKMLYFRKMYFNAPHDVDRWQVSKRLTDMRGIQMLGHEDAEIFDIAKLKETDDAWVAMIDGAEMGNPVAPVFSRIDRGVVGLFDTVTPNS